MTEKDFICGEKLLAEEREDILEKYNDYLSHEQEVKEICDYLISQKTEESLSKLIMYITENENAQYVMENRNWGRLVRFACKLYYMESEKKNTILLNVGNLEQLLFIMRNMRFLNYRYQVLNDGIANDELNALFSFFGLSEEAKGEILKVSRLPVEAY